MSCGGSKNGGTHLPANKFCCPQAEIFVEDLCGSVAGPLSGTTSFVWLAPTPNDYFQGTFTVTNRGPGQIEIGSNFTVPFAVQPGQTISISVNSPTAFNIALDAGEQADYCIRLYKRVN